MACRSARAPRSSFLKPWIRRARVVAGRSANSLDMARPATRRIPSGRTSVGAVRRRWLDALRDAGIAPEEIDYINAHGTGTTPMTSRSLEAILRIVFGDDYGRRVRCFLHQAGAWARPWRRRRPGTAPSRSMRYAIRSRRRRSISSRRTRCPINAIPNVAQPMPMKAAMSNSFAFGGINAVLILRALDDGA